MTDSEGGRRMIEVRGDDGRLLAVVSQDGRTMRIKRRSVVYVVDLVATWVEGSARVKAERCGVDSGGAAGVE